MEKYLEIKWHGREDQGVFTGAAVLAEVLGLEGKYVQAVPGFDCEKSRAFVQAYNRLSESPLRLHSAVNAADFVVIMDPGIIPAYTDVKPGAGKNATYIVNTPAAPGSIKRKLGAGDNPVYTLDAYAIAREETGKPNLIVDIPLMAVLLHCLQWIPMETFKRQLPGVLSRLLPADTVPVYIKSVDRALKETKEPAAGDYIIDNDRSIMVNDRWAG
jgi:pyruvate ferredoxin oxidoreductase gamma subunit